MFSRLRLPGRSCPPDLPAVRCPSRPRLSAGMLDSPRRIRVVPRSRCRLPPGIIMESRMDANAINHREQKKKARPRAGAAHPPASREPTGGRFPRRVCSGGVLSRCPRSAQMPAGAAAIVRLPPPPAGWIFADTPNSLFAPPSLSRIMFGVAGVLGMRGW